MSFKENIDILTNKIKTQGISIETEEATKNAFVMPFLQTVLEYDIFNPNEVIPEFTADHGTRKGEKVDYAIMQGGELQILVECKKYGEVLCSKHASQLFRYFSVTNARIAILTNGVLYQFYTDLEKPNQMDEKPFLEFNLEEPDENILPELRKLTKSSFDLGSIISAAGELKYLNQIKKCLSGQFIDPSDDFVKLLTAKVYDGVFTQKVKGQFSTLVRKALKQFLNDKVNERLKSALQNDGVDEEEEIETPEVNAIVTTTEELEAYFIIKAIIREVVDINRIAHRDKHSYFGVLLDDNNRKPICRLHFNRKQKYISIFDQEKNESKYPIESLNDIFDFSEQLKSTVQNYNEI
ncbi:MAG: type I restriction enzyme HsdR N-terminal domain-containing protein [Emcibacter sp.]|nr:type I restriction enzyme HsdR N-terminal domain-containing protein [Emcibacter sp.]